VPEPTYSVQLRNERLHKAIYREKGSWKRTYHKAESGDKGKVNLIGLEMSIILIGYRKKELSF